jgi:hypothetical protein
MDEQAENTIAEAVLKRYFAAMNAGDANAALALFADDAVRFDTAVPELSKSGLAAIEAGLRARVADQIQIEPGEYQSCGNSARCMARVFTNYGRRLGFAPVVERAEIIVEGGQIKRFTVTVMPDSLERIKSAELRQQGGAG